MNQIKYLIYSFLILLVLFSGYLFICGVTKKDSKTYSLPEVIDGDSGPAVSSAGQKLFQQNCQSCHSINKKLSGPALAGVTGRGPWTNKSNLYKWIKNPGAFISTTPYTRALQAEYGTIMPAFPQLSETEIDEILNYINQDVQSKIVAYAKAL